MCGLEEESSKILPQPTFLLSSQSDKRIRDLEAKASTLDSRITSVNSTLTSKINTAQSTANTANSNANSALSKFGSYYTKNETYSKTEVDSKISSSSSSGGGSSNCTPKYYWVIEDYEGGYQSCPGQGGVFKCNWAQIQVGVAGWYEGRPSCIREYTCTGGAQGTKSTIWNGTWLNTSSAPAECRR